MECPKCAGELMQLVNVMVECPAGYRKLNKAGMRSKKVAIYGADWAGALLVCHDCGWIHYGQSRPEATTDD